MTSTKGLKVLGRGSFTTAYKLNDEQVLLRSTDPCKECMSLGWFPDSFRFPKVERVDGQGLYLMKYYPNTRGLKSTLDDWEYQLYKELRRVYNECYDYHPANSRYQSTIDMLNLISDEFHDVRELLIEACGALSNYGDGITFEISPLNVRAYNGKLIFLDVFYRQSRL